MARGIELEKGKEMEEESETMADGIDLDGKGGDDGEE